MSSKLDVKEIDEVFTDLGEAELIPPKWVIKDLLPTGLVFLGAPPKSGKSTLEMIMSLLAAGVPCQALPPSLSVVENPGVVLGWSYEASAGELRHMCEEGLGVKVPNNRSILIADNPWAYRLDDDGGQAMLGWLNAKMPVLAWLDPLRDFHNLEEKDSGSINRLLRPLQRWAKDHDCCFLVVHHTKKKDEGDYTANDLRGTGAIFGIADAVLMLTPKGNAMTHIKAVFKRAPSWERTIKIAAYDNLGAVPTEQLGDVEKLILNLLAGGAPNLESIAKQLKVGKLRVIEGCRALERAGLIRKEGKAYVVTDAT